MMKHNEETQYSPDNRRPISRARLERIQDQLLAPVRKRPPEIGTYSRAIDVELFQIFWNNPVVQVGRLEATLAGEVTARERQDWAFQVESIMSDDVDEHGRFHEVEVKFDPPRHYAVPRYASVVEDALELKDKLLGLTKHLRIEEVSQDDELPLWRAEIVDEQGHVESSGETYDTAGSIVLALVSDLLTNKEASWWITITD
jgi:hypothetical protein